MNLQEEKISKYRNYIIFIELALHIKVINKIVRIYDAVKVEKHVLSQSLRTKGRNQQTQKQEISLEEESLIISLNA